MKNFLKQQIFAQCLHALKKIDADNADDGIHTVGTKPPLIVRSSDLDATATYVDKCINEFKREHKLESDYTFEIDVPTPTSPEIFWCQVSNGIVEARFAPTMLLLGSGKNSARGLGLLASILKREFDYSGYGDFLKHLPLFLVAEQAAEFSSAMVTACQVIDL